MFEETVKFCPAFLNAMCLFKYSMYSTVNRIFIFHSALTVNGLVRVYCTGKLTLGVCQ
jgi:hypothetical protein